jgi:hypothetical protein
MTSSDGIYSTTSRHYQDEGTAPKVVVAISAIIWELTKLVTRSIASILGGLVDLPSSGGIAFLVIIVLALLLNRSITILSIKA